MQLASEVRALEYLREQLTQAFEAGDWESIREVDGLIRTCLGMLAKLPGLSDEVLEAKQALQHLHQQVRRAGGEECERLRLILLNHLQQAEGRNAYMQIDMYQRGSE